MDRTVAESCNAIRKARTAWLLFGCAAVALPSGFCFGGEPAQAKVTFVTYDVCKTKRENYGTGATNINNSGDVTGACSTHARHRTYEAGYVRLANGTVSIIANDIYPQSINDGGEVTGFSKSGPAFIYTSGSYETFGVKGARGTRAYSISNNGEVTGEFDDENVDHGFLRRADGTIITFDDPNAGTEYPGATRPRAMNNHGEIVGYYVDSDAVTHGFLRTKNKAYVTIDPPGAVGSEAQSINLNGTIAGDYSDSNNVSHGFVRTPDGTITSFDAPDGSGGILVRAINKRGSIVGNYYDANGVIHGALRSAGGIITSIDAPGAGTAYHQGTFAMGINDSGEISGYFIDSGGSYHGFLRLPH